MNKISIIGIGYVGLACVCGFAKLGNIVYAQDIDKKKVMNLKKGNIDIYEPDISRIFKRYLDKKIFVSLVSKSKIRISDFIFICVGTPTLKSGRVDLNAVKQSIKFVKKYAKPKSIIVIKSTIPPLTCKKLLDLIPKNIGFAHNPEFLREGSALKDFLHPDRIVIGTEQKWVLKKLLNLYKKIPAYKISCNLTSAELIKYASNAFLATKISFINEIANLCEKTQSDILDISKAIGLDKRIGPYFLNAGVGWGGSCFPKDIKALQKLSEQLKCKFKILKSVIIVNQNQRKKLYNKLKKHIKELDGKIIGVLGLSFKPNTDDIRNSPAIEIIKWLEKDKAIIKAYDPKAMENFKKLFPKIEYTKDKYQVFKDASAVFLITEWKTFKSINFKNVKKIMRGNLIIDGRNFLDKLKLEELGFRYEGIGRG